MMINGTDYTIYIVVVLTVVLLAALEYTICRRAKNPSMRKALLFIPFLVLLFALFVYGSQPNGSFLDLRDVVALMRIGYAAVCAVAICIGWFVFAVKEKKEDRAACPYSEATGSDH